MVMRIPTLYHWSSSNLRTEILKMGLQPLSPRTINQYEPERPELCCICLSFTPSSAWTLSGGTGWTEVEEWDLWQVRLNDNAEVHFIPVFGNNMGEVRVKTVIPPNDIWFVGSRKV